MPPRKVMIIRHAEKPTASPACTGVSADGEQDNEDLIVQGWQRSGALIRFFNPTSGKPQAGLNIPGAIYASAVAKHSESKRPQHTIAALADSLGLPIAAQFVKDDVASLVQAVMQETVATLIAWEHQLIPAIVGAIVRNDHMSPAMAWGPF